jgi:Malonate decarboxylase gamma subunit (MdcE)
MGLGAWGLGGGGGLDSAHRSERSGQKKALLLRRDELFGLQRYLAHLARCVELARQRGHRSLALVYDQALSGSFLANGLMTDLCAALPGAEIYPALGSQAVDNYSYVRIPGTLPEDP